jgi:signal transduction histidine kinase
VLREARRLQSLVQDLMSLSRIEAEKHDRPRDTIDLAQVAASVAADMATVVGAERISVDVPATPLPIRADRGQIDQLVRNLVDNALKYGEASQPVALAIAEAGGEARLSVADRGPGIAAEQLPHLTRRFYRTDPGAAAPRAEPGSASPSSSTSSSGTAAGSTSPAPWGAGPRSPSTLPRAAAAIDGDRAVTDARGEALSHSSHESAA